MMTTLVYVIAYLGIVFFLIAVAARFVFWSRMPMHVRWELYPVAHEGGGRAAYGGSYLEETDWWKKPRDLRRKVYFRVEHGSIEGVLSPGYIAALKKLSFQRKLRTSLRVDCQNPD